MNVEQGGRATRRQLQLRSIIHTNPQRVRKCNVSDVVIEGSRGVVCRSRGGVVDVVAEIEASGRARVRRMSLRSHVQSNQATRDEYGWQ